MRIVVCLKQAVDVSQLKVDPVSRQLLLASAPRKISDFDKNALEEAIRVREKVAGSEVFTLTVTAEDAKTTLREALAIGADKAYVVNDAGLKDVDTLGTARVLSAAIRKIGNVDLVLCGETSLDSFSGLVGSRLAELLGFAQVGSVRKLSVEGDSIVAERTVEDSNEVVRAKLPVLVSVTREINQPRIPSLMMIMKASKKEIVSLSLLDLGFSGDALASKIEILDVSSPKSERKKIKITGDSVQEVAEKLAKALIQEGVVGR
jgi:electron transfer flavoprotein beta subunit